MTKQQLGMAARTEGEPLVMGPAPERVQQVAAPLGDTVLRGVPKDYPPVIHTPIEHTGGDDPAAMSGLIRLGRDRSSADTYSLAPRPQADASLGPDRVRHTEPRNRIDL